MRETFNKISNVFTNPNGVVKDHRLSRKFSFNNQFDYSIVSHPSNCEILLHKENCSKGGKCSITYEELIKAIENW